MRAQMAEIENQMVSVERAMEYTTLPVEDFPLDTDGSTISKVPHHRGKSYAIADASPLASDTSDGSKVGEVSIAFIIL
jgi:hypothetical protein